MLEAHAASKPAPGEGHQTETFDAELVPDERGRARAPTADCPVEVALAAISGRWTTLVLRELMDGPHSFGDLREALPDVSAKVLTERLGELTARDLAVREEFPTFPRRTSYRLTSTGESLRLLLIELYRTGAALLDARQDVS